MLEPEDIAEKSCDLFHTGTLNNQSVIITAGPTQEAIDPVRFFSNHSSGKMGFALAKAAAEAGADVTLIAGPVHLETPEHVKRIDVVSAVDMFDAVMTEMNHCDIFIGAAAVADYRCEKANPTKLPKHPEGVSIQLTPNPDILFEVSNSEKRPFVVGFAAQTDNLIERATEKLQNKKLDMIAVNKVGVPETGFATDNNALTVLFENKNTELPLASKAQIARDLIQLIADQFHEKNTVKNT